MGMLADASADKVTDDISATSKPAQMESVQATSYVQDLNPKATVNWQLQNLTKSGGGFLEQAKYAGARKAGQRGFNLDSSITAGAATGAVMDRALPVASQDAESYRLRQSENLATQNDTSKFNAAQSNTARQSNVNAVNAAQMLERDIAGKSRLSAQDYQQNLGTISATGEETRKTNAQTIQSQELMQQRELEAKTNDLALQIQSQERMQGRDITFQQAYQQAQIRAQKDLETQAQQHDTDIQKLKGEQSVALANIEADNKLLLQTNQTAGTLFQSYQSAIAEVLNDPNMTPNQISSAVTTLRNSMQSSMNLLSGISGLDLSGFTVGGQSSAGTPIGGLNMSNVNGVNLTNVGALLASAKAASAATPVANTPKKIATNTIPQNTQVTIPEINTPRVTAPVVNTPKKVTSPAPSTGVSPALDPAVQSGVLTPAQVAALQERIRNSIRITL